MWWEKLVLRPRSRVNRAYIISSNGRYAQLATLRAVRPYRRWGGNQWYSYGNSLDYGEYALARNNTTALTLARTALDANPSLLIRGNRFYSTAGELTGVTNVALSATSTNSWTYRNEYGDLAGESFDSDGLGSNDCGSIRWDDSSCQLVEQTEYQWRNDDGGIDAPDDEWFNTNWNKRQRVRLANNDNVTYGTSTFRITVPYDTNMQADLMICALPKVTARRK